MTGWECIRRTSAEVEAEQTSLARPLPRFLRQLAENHDSCGSAHEDFAIGNHRSDEFVAGKTVAPASGLAAVIKFSAKIARIVRVQHRCPAILDGPDDSVRCAICRYARRRAGITERG